MKMKILAFAFIALLAYSCNKPPEACIEIDNTSPAVGESVTFTSCSKRTLSFIWRFDGPVGAPENAIGSSDESFQMDFSVPGAYTITLEAYKKFSFLGEMNSTSESFTVQ